VDSFGLGCRCRTPWIGKAPRRLPLLLSALLTSFALLSVSAPSASALPERFFGVHAGVGDDATDMEAIARSGAKYYHLQLSRTSNVAAAYDPIFQLAWERDITILPYLYSGGPTGGQFPTLEQLEIEGNGPGTWIYFVYDVVHRYGFQGDFWYGKSNARPVPEWEIWNEPNLRENNPGGASVYPESYTRFARRMAVAIQAAQKEKSGFGTRVNFGNLFSAGTSMEGSNYKSMNVGLFLEKAKNVDPGGSNFTGLALHPYSFQIGVKGVEDNVNFAREKLNQFFGGSTKELWITEVGWLAEGGDAGHPAYGEPVQAQNLTESFNWIRSVQAAKNIQSLIYFNYQDYVAKNESEKWAEHAGLRRIDSSFRPAWFSFQEQTGAPRWPKEEWMSVAPRASDRALEACLGTKFGAATCSGPLWQSNSGTDVSVTTLGEGNAAAVAFNGTGGQLSQCRVFDFLGANCWSSGASIATGTSPAVTTLTGGAASGTAVAAFNSPSAALHTCQLTSGGPANCANHGWVLAAGSNPSIAPFGDGSAAVAFRGASGQLSECRVVWSGGSNCWSSGISMAAGTTPGIAQVTVGAAAGSTVVAFPAPSGALQTCQLTTTGPANCANQGWVLASGSSPTVTALTDGSVAVGFNGSSGQFSQCRVTWSGGSNCWSSGIGMATGTTPAITGLFTGTAMAAFRNSSGRLGTCELTTAGPTHCADHGWAVAAGTIPSASPFYYDGSASVVFMGGGGQLSACRVTAAGGSNCWSEPETLAPLTNPKVTSIP
jgi:hypothetical protein